MTELEMTVKDFEKLSEIGRFFTFIFFGQSCVNCGHLIEGTCTSEEHLEFLRTYFSTKFISKPTFSFYKGQEKNIFCFGRECPHWELLRLWEKEEREKNGN